MAGRSQDGRVDSVEYWRVETGCRVGLISFVTAERRCGEEAKWLQPWTSHSVIVAWAEGLRPYCRNGVWIVGPERGCGFVRLERCGCGGEGPFRRNGSRPVFSGGRCNGQGPYRRNGSTAFFVVVVFGVQAGAMARAREGRMRTWKAGGGGWRWVVMARVDEGRPITWLRF